MPGRAFASQKCGVVFPFGHRLLSFGDLFDPSAFAAQAFHLRWFWRHLPDDDSVRIENISQSRIGFQIAGPNSRELLQRLTRADVSNEALPFLSVREVDVGQCSAIVQRVSYTGDRGYEIYVPANQQAGLFDILETAGSDLGLRPFGMRAMMSLRLEKSFGSWMSEFKPDYTPMETGLDRFVAYDKAADFIGKRAALDERSKGVSRKLCSFIVDATDSDVAGYEPIWHRGQVVGFVTSGGYAHYSQKSVAFGFVPIDLAADDLRVEIEILGERRPAVLYSQPLFDADRTRVLG